MKRQPLFTEAMTDSRENSRLIRSLLSPAAYPHPTDNIRLIETHVSWLILTGDFVYKIKKPADLGFLDYSTLEKRKFFCEEELRLNLRFAPDLYLEVVGITGTEDEPSIGGDGPVIEYAVKMKQFPQPAQLDRLLDNDLLTRADMESAAAWVGRFHAGSAAAGQDTKYGTPEQVWLPVLENFNQILPRIDDPPTRARLDTLLRWSEDEFTRLKPIFEQRRKDGFIRECHGDLHLSNLIKTDQGVAAFDCIEFDPMLRWIDVISEIAFLVMDLEVRDRSDLAFAFTNRYLEITGDYAGMPLMQFHLVYKSMVRAKVAAIRLADDSLNIQDRKAQLIRFEHHVGYAESATQRPTPKLIICHGLSGSGKTFVSDRLLAPLSAIRVRSDIERKRLHGLAAGQSSGSDVASGIYSAEAGLRTYERLAKLTRPVVDAGYTVIVDAAFLKKDQRQQFETLADDSQVPFVILNCMAERDTLRRRIIKRDADNDDASEANLAVLKHQLSDYTGLDKTELASAIVVDTGRAVAIDALVREIRSRGR
jgi:aminoglycoside phosphotransferase family enzyme/predicted kinase